ncbi:MAG TPA: hypothetical protein VGR82_04970 [Methylomirabilota bacterium]|nr:hypothetical protein [Methylomirabilota bacterium]
MKLLTRLAVGCALLTALIAAPASAEFTPEEKAQELHFRTAAKYLSTVTWTYQAYTLNSYVTPATRAQLALAADRTIWALSELNDAYSALAGDVAIAAEGTQEFDDLVAGGRSARLGMAWHHLERLKTLLIPGAIAQWQAAQTLLADPTYQDYINRIIMTHEWVLAELNAFDPALPYTDPKPLNVIGTKTFPADAVIGPHGLYPQTQWHRWRGRVYTIRAMQDIAVAIGAADDTFNLTNAGRPWMSLGIVVERTFDETAATSNMQGVYADPFVRTLETHRSLTSKANGIPGSLHFSHFDIDQVYLRQMGRVPAFDAAVRDAVLFLADAWSHFDDSAWFLNIFPGCPPVCVGGTGMTPPPPSPSPVVSIIGTLSYQGK